MYNSPSTDVKLKFRIVYFSRKVLVERENITLKKGSLSLLCLDTTNGIASKRKLFFPLACCNEEISPLMFINAVLDSDNNRKESLSLKCNHMKENW